jgi:hypothetical protein
MAKSRSRLRSKRSIRKPAAKKHTYQTHVILPDVHCRKSDLDSPHGISRADLFRKLCADVKPTKILALGDVGEFDAASSFDLDKPGVLVDRDLKSDIDITVEFLERALGPKHKQGAFVQWHSGNHERRLWKIGAQNPSLRHLVNIEKCLQVDRYFHTFVDYDGAVPGQSLVDGILYAHYHVGGAFAKPLGGLHTAYSMLSKGFGISMCQVHSHQLDFKVATTRTASDDLGNGKKIFGLVAGCFIEPSAKFDYCGSAVRNTWWSGITIIRGVDDGSFSDIRFVSLDELRRTYG